MTTNYRVRVDYKIYKIIFVAFDIMEIRKKSVIRRKYVWDRGVCGE